MKPIKQLTSLIASLLIIGTIFLFHSCKTEKKEIKSWRTWLTKEPEPNRLSADTVDQILLWRRPKKDESFLNSWVTDLAAHGDIRISLFCGSCDSSLMLISGPGVQTFIMGTGGKGGGTGCQINCPTGGGDTIYWCVNFPVAVPELSLFNPNQQNTDNNIKSVAAIPPDADFENSDEPITVAVFDTGIDTVEIKNHLYRANTASCLNPNAADGWNFPGHSSIVQDDYDPPKGHGATVASLIIQQSLSFRKNPIIILPVKIHGSDGSSDLYSVLCGLAYAKQRSAKIINASFGYYNLKRFSSDGTLLTDSSSLLMKEYIQYYLTETTADGKPILLIAAAGNANNDADEIALFTHAGLPAPHDLRNLDSVYFYPASYAADPELTNVIAVTTVDTARNMVSPIQNYSGSVVDLGVNADMVFSVPTGDKYSFKNPRQDADFVDGSSFATPIATGIIASHYHLIETNPSAASFHKDDILGFLLASPGVGNITNFGNRIKTGIMYNRTP